MATLTDQDLRSIDALEAAKTATWKNIQAADRDGKLWDGEKETLRLALKAGNVRQVRRVLLALGY